MSVSLCCIFTKQLGFKKFKIALHKKIITALIFAFMFFDTKPAIITNTFQTTFVPNLSTSTFDGNNLVIYPNPAREMVQVSMTNSTETLSKIVIYDMIGKAISGNNVPQVSIPVNDFATGVYLMEITTETNPKQVKKLIIKQMI